jgi:hypothetical protein
VKPEHVQEILTLLHSAWLAAIAVVADGKPHTELLPFVAAPVAIRTWRASGADLLHRHPGPRQTAGPQGIDAVGESRVGPTCS